ncbi:jg27081, partial [Pararge aegeria aegeria]
VIGSAWVDINTVILVGFIMDNLNLKITLMEEEEEKKKLGAVSNLGAAPSIMSVESMIIARRKRPLREDRSEPDSASSDEAMPASKVGAARRGRGRPPTSGKYVGLAKAKRELAAAEHSAEQAEKEAAETEVAEERELATLTKRVDNGPVTRLSALSSVASEDAEVDMESLTATDLNLRVQSAVNLIKRVAKVSKGLNGTCKKALKEAVDSMEEAAEVLMKRTSSEEVARLQVENSKLVAEMAELQKEQEKMRADLLKLGQEKGHGRASSEPKQPEAESEQFRLLLKEVSSLSTRFSVIEGRVLRPPLTADRNRVAGLVAPSFVDLVGDPKTTTLSSQKAPPSCKEATTSTKGKGKGKGKATAAPTISANVAAQESAGASAPVDGQWQTAGAKKVVKKKKKKASKAAKTAAEKEVKQQVRLRTPRSAAVVITLQPEAKEKGFTYAEALAKAKAEINLSELGIAGIRCKTTVTGARMLEVAGATSGPQADALAEKMRASLQSVGVKVSRPTKSAELRIVGLDDSVKVEELVAAVARVGDCSPAQVKSSPINTGFTGLGTAVISCPVAAAKKLVEGGRILVGWVSAQVKVLQPKSLRCYRCLMEGHVSVHCTSKVDRSQLCFRCGQPGHKAGSCEATPHCVLCADVGKPTEHRMGTKTCAAPIQKSNAKSGRKGAKASIQMQQGRDVEEEGSMDCH